MGKGMQAWMGEGMDGGVCANLAKNYSLLAKKVNQLQVGCKPTGPADGSWVMDHDWACHA
jgi:hypothetical protein